jgi:hypothetical protein
VSVTTQSVVLPAATVTVPVGVPDTCELTVTLKATDVSLPYVTEEGVKESAVDEGSPPAVTVRSLAGDEAEPVKLVSPP